MHEFLTAAIHAVAPVWVDCLSIIVGIFYTIIVFLKGKPPKIAFSTETIFLFSEGAGLAPLALLIPAAFSAQILTSLVESSRLTLVMSGLLGFVAVASTRFRTRR